MVSVAHREQRSRSKSEKKKKKITTIQLGDVNENKEEKQNLSKQYKTRANIVAQKANEAALVLLFQGVAGVPSTELGIVVLLR